MADNKKYYYLKLKDNFYDTEAMILLENMENGYLYSNILMKMYLRSLKCEGKLMYNDRIPYNAQMLSKILRHNVDIVEKAIKIFKELDLIEIMDNGAIYMLDIQNYIGKSSTEADRIRNYRNEIETQKNIICTNVQQMYDKSTPEIEIEKDIEIKEKEILKKKKYGEFKNVLLTDDEYYKLEKSNLLTYIERLSSYIASKGKRYKSHYATILNWSRKEKPNKKSLEDIMKEIK